MGKFFSLKTKESSRRLFVFFAVLILVFGFFGRLVETNGNKIKIEEVTLDAHGAALHGWLYTPAGTSDYDSIPAVITVHGYVCNGGVTKGLAEEISRRGFVVFCVDSFGTGLSETPEVDASGSGRGQLKGFGSDTGTYDILQYMKGLGYVDSTRIAMVGHSMGSRRTDSSAILDCTYYTLNDIKLNLLHDEFGIAIAAEQLYEDADKIAQSKLNADQKRYYDYLMSEYTEDYNSMLKAICMMGSGGSGSLYSKEVEVAGHKVMRQLKTNMAYISGNIDSIWNFMDNPSNQSGFYMTTAPEEDAIYAIDEQTSSSSVIGNAYSMDRTQDPTLAKAFDERNVRYYQMVQNITHSKEYFDNEEFRLIVSYLRQALNWDWGNLGAADATPYGAEKMTWGWRVACNGVMMFSMFAMLICLAGYLTKSDVFCDVVAEKKDRGFELKSNKIENAIIYVLSIAASFFAIYFSIKKWSKAKTTQWLRFVTISGATTMYLYAAAGFSLLFIAYYIFRNKKMYGKIGLNTLNIDMRFSKIMKTLLLTVILGCTAYTSLLIVNYWFGQDYRIWEAVFTFMPPEYWIYAIPYMLLYFVLYLIIGVSVNYNVNDSTAEWKDTLITVLVNSAGVWICCQLNYMIARVGGYSGTLFANFIVHYGFVTVVPVTVYITRKCYKLTNSIWLGAMLNTFLVSWTMASNGGTNTLSVFTGQTLISNFLN